MPTRSATPHILLTGGTGFFGLALLRHWLAQEQAGEQLPQVTILARAPAQFLARFPEFADLPWLHFAQGDVLQPQSFPTAARFSHVLHAATDSTKGPALSPLQRYGQIVQGTRHLLDYALQCGARRFLLTSSGAVYGPQPAALEALPEDHGGSPDSMQPAQAYGMGKRAAEHLCALYTQSHGLETVVARCFAFVGPDLPLDVHFAIGNFIRDALWAEAITVNGDGTPLRSYLDQSDLAPWLLAMLYRGRSGQAYNLGSDQAISMTDLAHLVRDTLAPHKPVRILGQAVPDAARNRYIPSVAKAQRELGLRVTKPLRQAILDTAPAHLQQSARA